MGCREIEQSSPEEWIVAKGMSIAVLLDAAGDSMTYEDWSWCAGYSNCLICDDVAIHPIYCQKLP